MSGKKRKFARIIAEGLALSARATAWRDGQSWEPEERRGRGTHPDGISEAYPGASLRRLRIQ
jgi:hypothetical protein